MSKEKICLICTGVICLMGCIFISVYNVIEANYSKSDIIPGWEYSDGIIPDGNSERTSASDKEEKAGTININTATVGQLADFLPGIGMVKAQAIVDYRERAGEFVSVDELVRVDGIGEKTLEKIRPYCRISD